MEKLKELLKKCINWLENYYSLVLLLIAISAYIFTGDIQKAFFWVATFFLIFVVFLFYHCNQLSNNQLGELKSAINTGIVNAREKLDYNDTKSNNKMISSEDMTKRFRLAERIVEEICRTKEIKNENITAIKDVINNIICVSRIIMVKHEPNDIVGFLVSDANNNCFEVKYNLKNKCIESIEPDGEFRITSQIILEVEGSAIKSVNT